MADDRKGIVRRIVAIFDRDAAKKMEGEFEGSLKSAGERGGRAAGNATMSELRKEFDKRKAELAQQLAAGVINKDEWKRQTDAAAQTFNAGVLKLMDEAKAKGADGEREFNKLGRAIKRVGDEGHASIGGRLVAALKTAAVAAAALFALDRVRAFGRESIAAFEALRTGQRQLEQQLANTGVAWAEVSAEVRATARALWDTHRLTEGEVQGTLRQLVMVTGDYERSLRSVGLAHDIMAATGLGAEQAARYLGRIMNGDVNVLRRYGITLSETGDAVAELTEKLQGSALAATSNAVTWQKAMGDLKETIGGLITAAFGMDEGFSAAAEAVRKLNDALSDNAEEWERVGRFTVRITKTIGHSIWIVAQSVGAGLSAIIGGVLSALNLLPASVDFVIRQLNRLPGVDIDVRMGRLPANQFLDEMRAANERVKNSVEAIGDAWTDVGQKAERARPAVTTPVGGGSGTGSGSAAAERDKEAEALERLRLQQEAFIENLQREIRIQGQRAVAIMEGEEAVAALNRELHIEEALLRSGAEAGTEFAEAVEGLAAAHWDAMEAARLAAQSVESDWSDAAEAVKQELDSLAASAHGVFTAIANGGIAGLARLAKAKVIENLAWAAENFAKMWGGNPLAAKAAQGHLVAAAKWGAVGVGARAMSGGGGSASMVGAVAPSTRVARGAERAGPEITIMIDPLDPFNPAYQKNVYAAEQYARERYGDAARITVTRRTT